MKSNLENLNFQTSIREQVVPSRKKVKLPAWLEVAKPRLIPLLLATTLGGMALTEEWPLSSPKLICTLGGGALAAAAAGGRFCKALSREERDASLLMAANVSANMPEEYVTRMGNRVDVPAAEDPAAS